MRYLHQFTILFCLFYSTIEAWPSDTGWKELRQPDGTTFIGRQFFDEYEYYQITKEGYPFELNDSDGYYYYADGVNGKILNLSKNKVNIDCHLQVL